MADDLRTNPALLVALPDGDPLTLRDVLEHQHALGIPRDVLAREHYFKTWERAEADGDRPFDRRFEAAADAIAAGDLATVQRLLAAAPVLATSRSAYGHRQQLLHHVAQNGIELSRQLNGAPKNMPDIARALLAAGADPNATAESYGDSDTVLTLLCSSTHPAAAGVQAELVEVLVGGGADPNDQKGAPLWTAIVWAYPKAADALVRCGARIDNLVVAAGAGDLDRTRELVDARYVDLPVPMTNKTLPAAHLLEYALIYAASCNRYDVVEFLLARKPDLSIREPFWDASALGAAEHHLPTRPEYARLVELLARAD
jgi:ankyrin repeat protein